MFEHINIDDSQLFEHINIGEPEINDYVLTYEYIYEDPNDSHLNNDQKEYLESINFCDTHIGRICYLSYDKYTYTIEYKYIPNHLRGYFINDCRKISRAEIKYWSKNKEDLSDENIKLYLRSKKYNII